MLFDFFLKKGLVIYKMYENCDPVSKGLVFSKDQLLPLFTLHLTAAGFLGTGFPGFLVAGVFSGALSTVSGGLNSLAAVTLEDFVKVRKNVIFLHYTYLRLQKNLFCSCSPLRKERDFRTRRRRISLKLWPSHTVSIDTLKNQEMFEIISLSFLPGIFSYVLIFLVKNIPGLVQAWLGIFGIFGGPVLGLFTLGMLFPRANSAGALSGGIASVVIMLWIAIGGNFSRLNGDISYAALKRPVSVEGCPADLNVTAPASSLIEELDWWPYLSIYELSYMWYACAACLIVLAVGVPASLIDSYRRKRSVQ